MMELFNSLHAMMQEIGADYAVCGGYAIDLFLGRKSRPHKDLDVAVFWEDRDRIVRFLLQAGWLVFEPYGGRYLHRIRSVTDQKRIKNNIWCVAPENGHYKFSWRGRDLFAVRQDDAEQETFDFVEFLFNRRENGWFLYERNPAIRMEMRRAIQKEGRIPYLAPALTLLYKSSAWDNPAYQSDYQNALPRLSLAELTWLNGALETAYQGTHAWAAEIRGLMARCVEPEAADESLFGARESSNFVP